MTLIYSDKPIDGLEGTYANPSLFDRANTSATKVFTDDPSIAEAYDGVKVEPISKPKAKAKANTRSKKASL